MCTGRCAHVCLLCWADESLGAVSLGLLILQSRPCPDMLWGGMCRCEEQLLGCCAYCPGSLGTGLRASCLHILRDPLNLSDDAVVVLTPTFRQP